MTTLNSLKANYKPSFVHTNNKYSIFNIKLWCKLNNKPFKLKSKEYKNNNFDLKWQCLKDNCKEVFYMNWDSIWRGRGCPCCSGNIVCKSNCLATKNPELAKEWHPIKNGDLTPYNVTHGSGKKVWWQCENGHEWTERIGVRNRENIGCPFCLRKRPSEEYNLLIENPELCECVDFNQYNIHHDKNVFDHIISVINNTPKILNVRLAALLHDVAKPKCFSVDEEENGHFYGHHLDSAIMAEEILKRLKFDNKTIESVVILVKEHMSRYDFLRVTSIKKFINRVGIDNLNDLFELQIADIKGSAPPHNFSSVINLKLEVERILNEKQPLTVKDLEINGHDLMEVGIQPGIKMGEILNELLEEVLTNPNINSKEILLNLVKENYCSQNI